MKYLWSFAACVLVCTGARAQQVEKHNMELVSSHDLQGRSAYQPVIHKQGDRWIAYIGHHGGVSRNPLSGAEEPNGTSILDVTDPKSPRYLAHVPGAAGQDEAGGAQMGRVRDGAELPQGDKSEAHRAGHGGHAAPAVRG